MAFEWQIQDSGPWSLMEGSVALPQYKMGDPGLTLKINGKCYHEETTGMSSFSIAMFQGWLIFACFFCS